MNTRRAFPAAGLIGLVGVLAGVALAQPEPPAENPNPGVEVLARGPVHEAYALPADQKAGPGPVVPRQPPEPIEELPPEERPEGDDVRWIPGYWSYDDERKDFVWVSGFWRVLPPGRVWMPGRWHQTAEGWQWVGGFWGPVTGPDQPEARLDYVPEPPPPVESGPSTPAPADDCVYLPGNWVYQESRYAWRPGYWNEVRPDWVWTPACYRWTPAGHVFVDGYWDYPLADRGVLFPPVCIDAAVYSAPDYAYTPTYAVQMDCLYGALFTRRGWGSYYFGDYFDQGYVAVGYTPWCGPVAGVGFGLNPAFGFGRGYHDHLYGHYRAAHYRDPYWNGGIGKHYAGRYHGTYPRPPRTLVQQNTVINNVVNNTAVVNNTQVNNLRMVAPLRERRGDGRSLTTVSPDARRRFAGEAQQFRTVAGERGRLESELATRRDRTPDARPAPRSARLSVPQQLVTRSPNADNRPSGPGVRPRPDTPAGPPRPAGIGNRPRPETPTGIGNRPRPDVRPDRPGRPNDGGPTLSPTPPRRPDASPPSRPRDLPNTTRRVDPTPPPRNAQPSIGGDRPRPAPDRPTTQPPTRGNQSRPPPALPQPRADRSAAPRPTPTPPAPPAANRPAPNRPSGPPQANPPRTLPGPAAPRRPESRPPQAAPQRSDPRVTTPPPSRPAAPPRIAPNSGPPRQPPRSQPAPPQRPSAPPRTAPAPQQQRPGPPRPAAPPRQQPRPSTPPPVRSAPAPRPSPPRAAPSPPRSAPRSAPPSGGRSQRPADSGRKGKG